MDKQNLVASGNSNQAATPNPQVQSGSTPKDLTPNKIPTSSGPNSLPSKPQAPVSLTTELPDSKAVVTTPAGGDRKKKIFLVVAIGILFLILAGGGGYFYFSQNKDTSGADQTLTSLSSPTVRPTIIPTQKPVPTLVPTEVVDEAESLIGCSNLDLESTPSAFLTSYCQGDYCSNKQTKETCEDVDVVTYASESGKLLENTQPDGIEDCVWETSGFTGECKVKYWE